MMAASISMAGAPGKRKNSTFATMSTSPRRNPGHDPSIARGGEPELVEKVAEHGLVRARTAVHRVAAGAAEEGGIVLPAVEPNRRPRSPEAVAGAALVAEQAIRTIPTGDRVVAGQAP